MSKICEPLLERWTSLAVSHSVTVIFFARSVFLAEPKVKKPGMKTLADGLYYQDFFKVAIENFNTADFDKQLFMR